MRQSPRGTHRRYRSSPQPHGCSFARVFHVHASALSRTPIRDGYGSKSGKTERVPWMLFDIPYIYTLNYASIRASELRFSILSDIPIYVKGILNFLNLLTYSSHYAMVYSSAIRMDISHLNPRTACTTLLM